jgi:hypothetical protein
MDHLQNNVLFAIPWYIMECPQKGFLSIWTGKEFYNKNAVRKDQAVSQYEHCSMFTRDLNIRTKQIA